MYSVATSPPKQLLEEEFEDTKGVIRICISQNRQHTAAHKEATEPRDPLS
jgi:hypothetical protein